MEFKQQKSWHITAYSRDLVISVSSNKLKQNYRSFKTRTDMVAVQKQTLPSFSSIISVLSIVFYCVGFIRVELEMNEQKSRINALENVAEAKLKSNDADMKIKNAPGKLVLIKLIKYQLGVSNMFLQPQLGPHLMVIYK